MMFEISCSLDVVKKKPKKNPTWLTQKHTPTLFAKVVLEGCVSWPLGPRGQLTQPSRMTLLFATQWAWFEKFSVILKKMVICPTVCSVP